jgi:ferredoxin
MINIPQEGPVLRALERLVLRPLRAADAAATRLYGWRHNPLHQSGALAAALLALLIVTGLYLLVCYRVGAPWQSIARLQADPFLGRWIRSLHRFASDAMVVAVLLHAWRLFAQARSWGPRALAWTSGVTLFAVLFVSGWTGYVMVWDTFGAELAIGGARLFDALPVLSEPVRRIFAGDQEIPSAFFFVNLFLHVALPLGAAAGLWIHLSRLARPTLLPPRPLLYAVFGALTALSITLPTPLAPEASLLHVERQVPADLFFAFWLPWANALPPWLAWTGAIGTFGVALIIPLVTSRPRTGVWALSIVDERHCTGCNQCPQDCPWDAITMIPREGAQGAQSALVARVNPRRCVSCGVCAGSCAPMGVGPAGHTGRDQIASVRDTYAASSLRALRPVAICCEHAAPEFLSPIRERGAEVRLVPCAGNLHTSVIELALRAGVPGVMIFSCPPRDCRAREGPKWLHERMFNDREAELQTRVDRMRVATAVMAPGDRAGALDAWAAFAARLKAYDDLRPGALDDPLGALCAPVPFEEPQ